MFAQILEREFARTEGRKVWTAPRSQNRCHVDANDHCLSGNVGPLCESPAIAAWRRRIGRNQTGSVAYPQNATALSFV